MALAGLYSSLRISGQGLADQQILILGAGEAGIGIADMISSAMAAEGLSAEEARMHCWLVDSQGLVVAGRKRLAAHKQPYAHEHPPIVDFLAAVQTLKPTAIIGVAGQPGTFSRPVVETMAKLNERPLIFAFSNPTSQSECTAEEAYAWSDGRAIFASGSPFDPVRLGGKTFAPSQGNNAYIFPGVGLGVLASQARHVTDEMFFVAARELSKEVEDSDIELGRIYPPFTRIREVSTVIAQAVSEVAYRHGLAGRERPADVLGDIRTQMFEPTYPSYV